LAYQLLADIGVVPTQDDRQRFSMLQVPDDNEEAQVQALMVRMIKCAAYRASVYGTSLGEMGKDLEAVGGRVNRKTGAIEVKG
jgi:hypothetical protein